MLDSYYFPIIATDNEKTDYSPMFPVIDEKQVKRSSNYYLEEIVRGYYRLCTGKAKDPLDVGNITVRCPYCAEPMQASVSEDKTIALFTCRCMINRKEG